MAAKVQYGEEFIVTLFNLRTALLMKILPFNAYEIDLELQLSNSGKISCIHMPFVLLKPICKLFNK
jgi:hypothetical protein